MTALKQPLYQIEDHLHSLRSLLNVVIFHAENTDPQEFGKMKSDIAALYYLMLDKIDAADTTTEAIYKVEWALEGATVQ